MDLIAAVGVDTALEVRPSNQIPTTNQIRTKHKAKLAAYLYCTAGCIIGRIVYLGLVSDRLIAVPLVF